MIERISAFISAEAQLISLKIFLTEGGSFNVLPRLLQVACFIFGLVSLASTYFTVKSLMWIVDRMDSGAPWAFIWAFIGGMFPFHLFMAKI